MFSGSIKWEHFQKCVDRNFFEMLCIHFWPMELRFSIEVIRELGLLNAVAGADETTISAVRR